MHYNVHVSVSDEEAGYRIPCSLFPKNILPKILCSNLSDTKSFVPFSRGCGEGKMFKIVCALEHYFGDIPSLSPTKVSKDFKDVSRAPLSLISC